ncbi:adenylate kinase [Nocardioides sp. STR2]|uniref:Adenylate kinase n=1 Tax=Nocardioides pini TaxID=2975053 RepID=A0ABT4CBZ7_9ACTN|nr:adenylate kinase [Nocardioides pini]MCY4726346.1 adenylate kinase [Nocardioides pini]
MKLLLMGPPGAGKGTQASRFAADLRAPHISTGDIFRENVAGQTPLGKQAQAYMDRGEYVPDELTNALVAERLARADAQPGFILDGYPRTPDQVAWLDAMLSHRGQQVDHVLWLDVARTELVTRLTSRAAASGRSDDDPAVVERRLDVFDAQTAPLLALYRARGILRSVDGVGTLEQVAGRMRTALDLPSNASAVDAPSDTAVSSTPV